ncbi:MAG: hypothetical protein JWM27_875 [Gemmatimonadetes bacterium]|nr:hypothetical protein [Gemmatimonadota bacterium]
MAGARRRRAGERGRGMNGGGPRTGYGARLALWVAGLVALGGGSVAVLLRTQPAFQVNVFGRPAADGRVAGAAEIRPAVSAGVRFGRMGDLLLDDLRAEHTPPYLGWTTLGLDVRESALLGDARRLAAAGQWAPALERYGALVAAHPGLEPVALERARLLSWSGDPAGAGAALASIAAKHPADAALRTEAARYYWWAARAEEADSLAGDALRIAPADSAARTLRAEVRRQSQPSVRTATRWWRENDGPTENLQLARALERDRRYAPSLRHFRAALRSADARPAADSLPLEMASAALAADSPAVAAEGYGRWLRDHPADRRTRLALARARVWSNDYAGAIPVYRELLAQRDSTPLRVEMAQAQVWSGREAEAEGNLRSLVAADSTDPKAWRMLGDLARWRADWKAAGDAYARSARLDPAQTGIGEALADAAGRAELARRAALPPRVGEGRVAVESFGDTRGFRWTTVRGARHWEPEWGTLDAVVEREMGSASAGSSTVGGPSGSPAVARTGMDGYGASLRAGRRVGGEWSAYAQGGARDYPDGRAFATWGAGISKEGIEGRGVSLEYAREPAVRRAATFAALRAGAVSDLLRAQGNGKLGGWSAFTQAEAERLHASAGTTGRLTGSVALARPLGAGFQATASLGAVTTGGGRPVMPDGEALWWTPAWYVEPQAGLAWRRPRPGAWSVGVRANPGWAWVRERGGSLQRFSSSSFPTLGLGTDVQYRTGRWSVGGTAGWDGALGGGYRSLGVTLGGAYALEVRR